ncbi:MAG: hypothetical protein A3F11_07120 [Gammaproteobacteria bacterium RIFCSPHIGHO2_12_FULL_37_14]|nr:MAG: hypothetical protein A3F11_07120 [Gammaproteobacteria bacterium RIFCSPHIGHO2_12_FULL_37_14]
MIEKIFCYFLKPEGLFLTGCLFAIFGRQFIGGNSDLLFLTCLLYWAGFFSFRVFVSPHFKKLFARSIKQ